MSEEVITVVSCCVGLGLLILVILLPSSFVYFEYNEIGFVKYSINNNVNTDRTYDVGRYFPGPFYKAVVFPRNYQRVNSRLAIFTEDGQEFFINVISFYRLDIDRLAEIYDQFGVSSWDSQAGVRIDSMIKSLAPLFTINEYIISRESICSDFFYGASGFTGVAADLEDIGMVIEYDKFWLEEVEIPATIMQRNLDAAVQIEVNQMEENNREVVLVETETTLLEQVIQANITQVVADGDAQVQNIDAVADAEILTLDANADASIDAALAEAEAEALNLLATTDGDGLAELFLALEVTDLGVKAKYIEYFALLDQQTVTSA